MKLKRQQFVLQFLLHFVAWLLFYAFLYSLRSEANRESKAVFNFLLLSFTSGLASHSHFILFELFFQQRQYKKYVIFLVINILILSVFNQIVTNLVDELTFMQSLISLVFVNLFASAFYFAKNGMTKQIQVQSLKAKQLEAEMKLLKAQINPHFLFNTLNNLYGLVLQNRNQQAAEIILKLSALMRYLLESSKAESVSLQQEVQFIEDYLALEKIRLAQHATIRLEVAGLDNDVQIAPLLFIPLVENAFKHGLQSTSSDNFAYFSLAVQGNEIYFEAQNSITQVSDNQAQSQTGLANLRKRLALIYPEKHILTIEQHATIFIVLLHIRL